MSKSILIVDDEPSNIEVLADALRAEGFELLGATSGEDALERARKRQSPDLILLDVMMPGMDGFEVCRRLKNDSRTKDIPVIFVTALNEAEEEARGLELGAVDYIAKPCAPGIVCARARAQLELEEHRNDLERLVAERTRELKDLNQRLVAEVEARKLAEMALAESEERLREVLDNLPGVGVYRQDDDGAIVWMNQALLDMLGYGPELLGEPDACFETLFPDPDYRNQVLHVLDRSTEDFSNFEVRVQCGDNASRVFACSSVSNRMVIPGWTHWGVAVDVTDRKRVEQDLRQARETLERRVEERTSELKAANENLEREVAERVKAEQALQREKAFIDSVLATSHDGIAVAGEAGELRFVSPGMERLFGCTAREMGELHHWMEMAVPDEAERAAVLKDFQLALVREEPVERFFAFQRGDETRHCRFLMVRMEGGGVVVNGQDVTEVRLAQERVLHMALHDPLTGLANRQLFVDRLQQALRRARRRGGLVALLYVDLDRFKAMNDTHGHAFGDEVLREAGRRLAAVVRESDTVARIGGDELALVLPEMESAEQAAVAAERVVEALHQPHGAGEVYLLGASVGVAIHPRDGDDPDELLRVADKAMYRAKGLGGNRFWAPEIEKRCDG
jgi:diguanylate cyclase (GGDEF)-like protein/PAS domain S-box-containing protein